MTQILDNLSAGTVAEALREYVTPASRLSILTNSFSIYAFSALQSYLSRVKSVRLLIPNSTSKSPSYSGPGGAAFGAVLSSMTDQPMNASNDFDKPVFISGLQGDVTDRKYRNNLEQARASWECAKWLQEKADIRLLHSQAAQNLICIENEAGIVAIQGASAFTTIGLGIHPSPMPALNTLITDDVAAHSILRLFDSLWESESHARDVKAVFIDQMKALHRPYSPEQIYYTTLHHTFHDLMGDMDEDDIIRSQTGIKDTAIWNKLYRFQRDGVLGAIDKIEKYSGCIIADSVGLGKTFEALAIIKYYELRNDRVLVLCPKKLRENWTLYTINDRRNILAKDRFNYDVLNHTDLTRTFGKSGEINLESINWGNYDLVVIDESHNFRNNPSNPDGLTRYSRLMDDIIKSGVKTKVLMLSATPVNNRMNDLKNQVAFIAEGRDDAFSVQGIASIEDTLRRAQARFNRWLQMEPNERTTETLLDDLNFDYFKLLDLLTIARSRKHIVKYYDLEEIGQFPERAKPINIKVDLDIRGEFPKLRDINRDIRRLNLSSYSPLKYVLPHKKQVYSRKYDRTVKSGSIFTQIDREQNLIHLMRVNLLKRMESSIHSFALTVGRLLDDVREIVKRLESHNELTAADFNIEEMDLDEADFAPFVVGTKVKVLLQDVDRIRWKQELKEDEALLVKLLRAAEQVTAERDLKLARLKEEILKKQLKPINPGNKKVLVFTAFADTASYLYKHISAWAKKELGLYTALVTGGGVNQTTAPGLRKDIGTILSHFSPMSMERNENGNANAADIDILIATDCISEGQNLQDCDYVINYDIHWNPVTIIQRFGRVDRIGSKNNVIQLVNFWPNLELDEYINLESRVSGRMVLLDISATGEENIIEYADSSQMNDLEYRRRQLEKLQSEVLDLEDLSSGISITDLTLNDFRMDLIERMKEGGSAIREVPFGVFSVADLDAAVGEDVAKAGVIFCLRSVKQDHVFDSTYALAPYYLVYVGVDGDIVYSFNRTRNILDLLKRLTLGRSSAGEEAMDRFRQETQGFQRMGRYRDLLERAIQGITGDVTEQGVQSLFERGGTVVGTDSFRGIDDFEVIAFLAVMDEASTATDGVA